MHIFATGLIVYEVENIDTALFLRKNSKHLAEIFINNIKKFKNTKITFDEQKSRK
jgi:hypothetical protein